MSVKVVDHRGSKLSTGVYLDGKEILRKRVMVSPEFDVIESPYEGTTSIAKYAADGAIEYAQVPAIIIQGLAVTASIDKTHPGWVLTHIHSGFTLGNLAVPDQETAVQAALVLNGLADWSRRPDEILKDTDISLSAVKILRTFKLLSSFGK